MAPIPRPRPDLRLSLALGSAHAVSRMSRALRAGGGTAVPGRVASIVDPRALEKLAGRFSLGVAVVAGTNGKTTTARILAEILAADGHEVVHNRAGANLVGGIVATLTAGSRLDGRPRGDVAVLETDEAALPVVLERTRPSVVVLTNLFRDQLDRFAEVDSVIGHWRDALGRLPRETTLVVNADDPSLVALTDSLEATRVLYGIEESVYLLDALPHAAEVIRCQRCGNPLTYHQLFVGHLGDWRCLRCGISRPRLDVAADAIELWSQDFQSMKVSAEGLDVHVEVGLPGLFNSYNVIAAISAAQRFGVATGPMLKSIAEYRGAFGRAERMVHRGRSLMIMLVKNPVGCDEVLRTISGVDRRTTAPVLFALNDEASDGRDVSWIWDVDFEQLAAWDVDMFCSGSRSADMCNRLYYAGVPRERLHDLGADVGPALDGFADALPEGSSGFVLPTYSAMLQLRAAARRQSHVTAFWDQ